MSFDASELRSLSSSLEGLSKQAGRRARVVVRKTAKDIESTAKSLAPVDTGKLKNSIGTSDLRAMGTSGSIEAEVIASAEYSSFLEFGTSRAAAQPFMGPALDKHADPFEQALAQIVGDLP